MGLPVNPFLTVLGEVRKFGDPDVWAASQPTYEYLREVRQIADPDEDLGFFAGQKIIRRLSCDRCGVSAKRSDDYTYIDPSGMNGSQVSKTKAMGAGQPNKIADPDSACMGLPANPSPNQPWEDVSGRLQIQILHICGIAPVKPPSPSTSKRSSEDSEDPEKWIQSIFFAGTKKEIIGSGLGAWIDAQWSLGYIYAQMVGDQIENIFWRNAFSFSVHLGCNPPRLTRVKQ